ncbi:MAG: cytidine/deoxycytidylate deaminase family protein [Deltaproteobacteria bacterium]|nr:cytidine/deoxycytidylate deaminase family protein [Candidatus Anaeroferrophillacea bacterium]
MNTPHRPRPDWHNYFMDIARLVATRSTCIRRRVGAVIVKDNRILSTGYNGTPSGIVHCVDRGCLRDELGIPSGERHELCRGLHAEQNAIIQAAYHGVCINGGSMYCTNQPCIICAKMIINAGLKAIYITESYADPLAREILAEAGIPLKTL